MVISLLAQSFSFESVRFLCRGPEFGGCQFPPAELPFTQLELIQYSCLVGFPYLGNSARCVWDP